MALENLKSTLVTNLDATPAVRTTVGRGGPGVLLYADATLTGTTAADIGSTYRMVRIPSTAIVKRIWACLDTAVTDCTVDIGLYYGSGQDVIDSLRGTVIDADFWGSAIALTSIVVPTQYTMESTVCTVADMMRPVWDAVGLSSDPGGTFDIVFTNTVAFNGAPILYLAVEYVMPGAG